MSIKLKLIAVIAAFVSLVVIAVGVTAFTVNSLKKDSSIINLAGRQRMLAQKYTKELFADMVPAQVNASAIKAAEIATIQIKEDRAMYTKEVVVKLKKELPGFKPARDWGAVRGGAPLPATFVQEVSEKINKTGIYRYDLLSRWNLNKEKGLSSKFENEAFNSLLSNSKEPYYKFMNFKGKSVLRYATPDIAGAAACVSCHNAHPDSAKRDFKLGDVMGMLVITIPVPAEVAHIGSGSGADTSGGLRSYDLTARVFEKTLSALISGADAPLDLAMTKFITIAATDNESIVAELERVDTLWKEMKGYEKIVADSDINSPTYLRALDNLLEVNLGLVAAINKTVAMYEADSSKRISNMMKVLGFFVLLAFIVAAISLFLVMRSIVRPVIEVARLAEVMAAGDLSASDIKVKTTDEVGTLARALNTMKGNLNEMIGNIRRSSDSMVSATSELSNSSGQIVNGADTQSAQTSQVATAMEEMSATVIEVARNSQGASDAAGDTQQIAVAGGDVVRRAVDGMMTVANTVKESAETVEALGKSSDEIGAIISVINDIADQTNLLALNAAIEAARAGEQGRGFAVVADEVRKLAEKTTKATTEIADMIKTIQADTKGAMTSMHEGTSQVEEGVQLASEAGESLQQIVSSVDRVTDMVRQIATAAEQQSATSDEISNNITSIADIAGENSDGVRNISSAAEDLNKVAEDLNSLVGTFTLAGGGDIAPSSASPSEAGAGSDSNVVSFGESLPENADEDGVKKISGR